MNSHFKNAFLNRTTLTIIVTGLMLQLTVLVIAQLEIWEWFFRLASAPLVILVLLWLQATKNRLSEGTIYIIVLTTLCFIHLAYQYALYILPASTADTAIFEQGLWNLIQGRGLSGTLMGQYSVTGTVPEAANYFAGHQYYFLYPLSIIYRLFPSQITLIIIKTLLFGLTGYLAWSYLSIDESTESPLNGLIPATLLLQPAILMMPNFYESIFIPPLILWSAFAYKTDTKWAFSISLILLASLKEILFIVLLAWSLIAFLQKRHGFYIIFPIVIALSFSLIWFLVVSPAYSVGGQSPWLEQYLPVVLNFQFDLLYIIKYWFQMVSSWSLFPVLSPFSILAVPDLLLNAAISGSTDQTTIVSNRFQRVIVVGFFIGTVEGIRWANNWVRTQNNHSLSSQKSPIAPIKVFLSKTVFQFKTYAWILVIAASVANTFPAAYILGRTIYKVVSDPWAHNMGCIQQVARDHDASLICDFKLCGYFAQRENLWAYGYVQSPDILWDLATTGVFYTDQVPNQVKQDWIPICNGNNVIVYQPGSE